jgi:hypothetical protein
MDWQGRERSLSVLTVGRVAGTIIKVHRKDLKYKDTLTTPRQRTPSMKSKAKN